MVQRRPSCRDYDRHSPRTLSAHSASVLSAAAWMLLCVPILLYAHHQSLQGTFALSTNVTIAVLALGGSISEILSRLILIGATSTCNWMARKFNLDTWIEVENGAAEAVEDGLDEAVAAQQGDMIGWRVLELLYTFSHGLIVWIDSAEWSFLATIMVLIYIDVHKAEGTKFSRSWARFSLVIGIMAFFHFSSNVFHLHKWITYAPFAILLSLITKLFLLPVWLVWLGVQLTDHKPHATALPHSELSRCAVNGSDDDEGATAFT